MSVDLHILRHAFSEGNRLGIIQGKTYDPPLSKEGRRALWDRVKSGYYAKYNPDLIVHSDLLRATETAKAIHSSVKCEITSESLLRELSSGLLSGKKEAEIKVTHPNEAAIWNARGDFDGIQDAERGDEFQARAIAVLMKLREFHTEGKILVVAHTSINRCLINTLLDQHRNTPVEAKHLNVTTCRDIHAALNEKIIARTFLAETACITTQDAQYFVKKMSAEALCERTRLKRLQNYLNQSGAHVPQVLFEYTSGHSARPFSVEVQNYVPGKALCSQSYRRYMEDSAKEMGFIGQALTTYLPENDEMYPTLSAFFSSVVNNRNGDLPQVYHAFEAAPHVTSYLHAESSDKVLVDYDCHSENFLLTNDRVFKVDVDPIYAPRSFQAACWLSGVMLSSPDSFNFEDSLQFWPRRIEDVASILTGLKVRTYMACKYFSAAQLDDRAFGVHSEKARGLWEKYDRCFKKLATLTV